MQTPWHLLPPAEIGTAQQEKPVTTNTRPAFPDRDTTHVPTREECGEIVFQQIRSLMEDGHSQVLTREHAAEIAAYALKLLS